MVLAKHSFHILILFLVTLLASAQERLKENKVIQRYNAKLETDSLDFETRHLRANAYMALQEYYYAMKDYEFLLHHNPAYFLAFHHHNQLVHFEAPDSVVLDSSTALILQKPNSFHYSSQAYDAIDEGEYDKAILISEKAMLLDSMNYDSYEYRGYANFFLKNYEESIPDFRKLLEDDSTNIFALNNLASALTNAGQEAASIPYYRKVIELNPNFTSVMFSLGNTFYLLNQLDSAVKYFDLAIQQDSFAHGTFNARGNAYLNQGQYNKALADYLTALSMDSSDARYWGNAGLAEYNLGNNKTALTYLNTAIDLGGEKYYHFYDTRAQVYNDLERYEESNKDYLHAIALRSTMDRAGNIGWNYYLLGDYEACITYSKKAIENDSEAWYAHYNIALSLLCLNKQEESYAKYENLANTASPAAKQGAKTDLINLKKRDKSYRKEVEQIMKDYF